MTTRTITNVRRVLAGASVVGAMGIAGAGTAHADHVLSLPLIGRVFTLNRQLDDDVELERRGLGDGAPSAADGDASRPGGRCRCQRRRRRSASMGP